MTALEQATKDELVTTPEEVADVLLSGRRPDLSSLAVHVRPLRHGLAAVLIPRGVTRIQENRLRAALGVPQRPAKRRTA